MRRRRASGAGAILPPRHPPGTEQEGAQRNAAGQTVLKLKTRWGDDTTHRVMSPLEFMQKHINGFVVAKSTGSMSAEGRGLSIDRVERTTGPGRVADVR
jgi:hypothetical protein